MTFTATPPPVTLSSHVTDRQCVHSLFLCCVSQCVTLFFVSGRTLLSHNILIQLLIDAWVGNRPGVCTFLYFHHFFASECHPEVQTVWCIRASEGDLATLVAQTVSFLLIHLAFSARLVWLLVLVHRRFFLRLFFFLFSKRSTCSVLKGFKPL